MSTYKTLASMKTLPAAQIEAAIKFVQNHQNLFDGLEMKVCIIINNHDVFVQEDTEAEIELDQLMRSLNANFYSLKEVANKVLEAMSSEKIQFNRFGCDAPSVCEENAAVMYGSTNSALDAAKNQGGRGVLAANIPLVGTVAITEKEAKNFGVKLCPEGTTLNEWRKKCSGAAETGAFEMQTKDASWFQVSHYTDPNSIPVALYQFDSYDELEVFLSKNLRGAGEVIAHRLAHESCEEEGMLIPFCRPPLFMKFISYRKFLV